MPSSATQRRISRNRAIVDEHPRWRGIRHPELLSLPRTRFSRLDMLPAVERGRARPPAPVDRRTVWERRAAENEAIVAAHPRWRGITHPERLTFSRPVDESTAIRRYHAAIGLALAHLRQSETLCAEIDAVAKRIAHRRWGWSTNPAAAPPRRPPTVPPRVHPASAAPVPRRRVRRTLVPV